MEKIMTRAEVPEEQKWDLRALYETPENFDRALNQLERDTDAFVSRVSGRIDSARKANEALDEYGKLLVETQKIETYAMLNVEADTTDRVHARREANTMSRLAKLGEKTAFLDLELVALPPEVLKEAEQNPAHARTFARLIQRKAHMLPLETEAALAALAPALESPYQMYNDIKFGDIVFPDFEVKGKKYEMTYAAFENRYETDPDPAVRHKASEIFYQELSHHCHATASAYNAQVQREKIEATLRGYDSVFDFLLADQEVTREMYDRQIDTIMERLAPIMRRYALLLQKAHGLEKMTTYDLKVEFDPSYAADISYEEASNEIRDGLSLLGSDYVEIMDRAFRERWIDYAENRGKRTGAFCAEVYGAHPYILSSFNGKMDEVATLAHELGHAGQDILTTKAQSIFDAEMSMYIVEAPSTTNELIMENYLLQHAPDERGRKWVISQMISKTYFHNFVTHLLEAAYQREVYRMVEKGESVDAETLSGIYRDVLTRFWGDAVEVEEGSTLTWMRQPHYYMGLYSYTYSAGLTIGTQMALRLMSEGEAVAKQWKSFLASGGSKNPVELAAIVGVDITTDEPLNRTIDYIGSLVDALE